MVEPFQVGFLEAIYGVIDVKAVNIDAHPFHAPPCILACSAYLTPIRPAGTDLSERGAKTSVWPLCLFGVTLLIFPAKLMVSLRSLLVGCLRAGLGLTGADTAACKLAFGRHDREQRVVPPAVCGTPD